MLAWKQSSSDAGELEFRGRQAVRQALEGTLWVRASDGLPLRIQAWAEYEQSKTEDPRRGERGVRDVLARISNAGSVVHRHIVDGQTITENLYRYEAFRLFSSDSELKFTEVPDLRRRAAPESRSDPPSSK